VAATPPERRKSASGIAEKIAALQAGSHGHGHAEEGAGAAAAKETHTPHKLVMPVLGTSKDKDDEAVEAKPASRAPHRPSAAMLKLQGGVNIQALMGGARPPSLGPHSLGPMAEGEGAGEGEGEGASGEGRASLHRGSFSGRGSGAAGAVDADRLAALGGEGEGGGLVHAALSRPTMEKKKKPSTRKAAFTVSMDQD